MRGAIRAGGSPRRGDRVTVEGPGQVQAWPVTDVIVVVDVVRAFTTAAILMDRGAREIVCVSDPGQASELHSAAADRYLVGEDLHAPHRTVDLANSPGAALTASVTGRSIVFFTVNGTRVLSQTPPGSTVLCGALVNAGATAAWIATHRPGARVRLIVTDQDAGEDRACARYLKALIAGEQADADAARRAVIAAARDHERLWGAFVSQDYWAQFVRDVTMCADVDAVPLALLGRHLDRPGHVRLERATC